MGSASGPAAQGWIPQQIPQLRGGFRSSWPISDRSSGAWIPQLGPICGTRAPELRDPLLSRGGVDSAAWVPQWIPQLRGGFRSGSRSSGVDPAACGPYPTAARGRGSRSSGAWIHRSCGIGSGPRAAGSAKRAAGFSAFSAKDGPAPKFSFESKP